MSPEAIAAIITASASMTAAGHGISSTQVTALATVVLVVITAIYVIFTGFLVKEARRSSGTAQLAADAANRAADANARSAVVAEISLKVDFRFELLRSELGLVLALIFMGRSAVVYIFEVGFPLVILGREGEEDTTLEFPESTPFDPPDPLPCRLTPRQEVGFEIVFDPDIQSLIPEWAFAKCEIKYGFDQTDPRATYPFADVCLWQMPSPVRAELRTASRKLGPARPEERPRRASRTLGPAEPTLVPEPSGEPGEPAIGPEPAGEPVASARPVRRSRWPRWLR
jgi:hypothetical protein